VWSITDFHLLLDGEIEELFACFESHIDHGWRYTMVLDCFEGK
jgi:hypothetical protein